MPLSLHGCDVAPDAIVFSAHTFCLIPEVFNAVDVVIAAGIFLTVIDAFVNPYRKAKIPL